MKWVCGRGHRKPKWMSLKTHKAIENRVLYPLRNFISENDATRLAGFLEFFSVIGFGLNCGFPVHCILEYALDCSFLGLRKRRWLDPNLSVLEDKLGYRPCSRCVRKII